jgi:hypothetical protein
MGLVGLLIFLTASLATTEIIEKSGYWKNFIAIYGWTPAVTGDVKVKGVDANMDLT